MAELQTTEIHTFILFPHPLLILHLLEEWRHELFEMLKSRHVIFFIAFIDDVHNVVQKPHDEVVVVTILPEFEDEIAGGKVIIIEWLDIIYLMDSLL